MGNKSKQPSASETARGLLARERDNAIDRLNQVVGQAKLMQQQSMRMQQDMVRWMMAFMLLQNTREIIVDHGTLVETNGFVLERRNNVEEDKIVWSMLTREEAEERKQAAEDIEKAKQLAAPPQDDTKPS